VCWQYWSRIFNTGLSLIISGRVPKIVITFI